MAVIPSICPAVEVANVFETVSLASGVFELLTAASF
jgi:hypothetical protein